MSPHLQTAGAALAAIFCVAGLATQADARPPDLRTSNRTVTVVRPASLTRRAETHFFRCGARPF